MISKRAILGTVALLGLAAGIAAVPQAASASTDGLPDGPWRQTCDRAYVQDGTLHAACRRDGGKYVFASAQIGSCQSFANRNGTLYCEASDVSSSNMGQWSGSFRDSCRDIYVDQQGKLQASCRKNNGTYKRSNLQAFKCPSYRAGNRNGNLFCELGDGTSGQVSQWNGSFRTSCRDISSDSYGNLTATCQAANGGWRRTSISARQCGSYRAGNRDGSLICESGEGSSQNVSQWQGSYSGSCRDVSVDSNGTLTATCQAANGGWRRTSLSARECGSYRAGNRDGNLFCESGVGSSGQVSQWDGSFRNSCRDISADSYGNLTATCQAANGGWRRTSLSARQCGSYRAGNSDGNLVCESPDGGNQNVIQWRGSFSQTCRDISVDSSGTLTANCQTTSGTWNRSSLSPRDCGNDYQAGNRNGTLFCER